MVEELSLPQSLLPQGDVAFGVIASTAELESLSPLSAIERSLISDRCVEKRLLEFRAGRHAAKQALKRLGLVQAAILKEGRRPVFPEGFRGSIAHCGQEKVFAVAAATRQNRVIGIDCEYQKDLSPALLKRILTRADHDCLKPIAQGFEVTEKGAGLAIFSLKEAVYKAVSQLGHAQLGFQDVSLFLRPEASGALLHFEAQVPGATLTCALGAAHSAWVSGAALELE